MSRIRLILAWLLMAAVPLQGWAAATMLFCGPAQRTVHAHVHEAGDGADHHAVHAAHQHGAQAQNDAGNHSAGSHPQASGGDSHACSACAACSHSVALAQTRLPAAVSDVPRAELAEPLAAVLAQPSPVPDKPPRA